MFQIRYDARIIDSSGKLVVKKRFKLKDAAFNWAKSRMTGSRRADLRRARTHVLTVLQNSAWQLHPHSWSKAAGPLKVVFLHHSVTKQLPEGASLEEERAEMRNLDAIAHGRGFNGLSYCWVVFPSGRAWEGRGWLVIEAATEGHNTTSDSICFAGNLSAFKPTEAQIITAEKLINRGQAVGALAKVVDVRPHRSASSTSCPGSNLTDGMIEGIQRRANAA